MEDEEASAAEELLELSRVIRVTHVVLVEGPNLECFIARAKLAHRLVAAPLELQFRALYEEWSMERLVQELY